MASKAQFHRNKAANAKKKASKATKTSKKVSTPSSTKYDGKHGQFVRFETYAQEESLNSNGKKKGTAQTTHAVIQEVIREAEYSKHVDYDKTQKLPPMILFNGLTNEGRKIQPKAWGKAMESYIDMKLTNGTKTYEKRIRGKADQFQTITTKVDRKQKILLGGVLSMPKGTTGSKLKSWCEDSIAWLQEQYPNGQLKGVFLHRDESCPHLHFYAVPNHPDCDVARIHQGMRAKKQAKLNYKMGRVEKLPNYNKIYKEAMGKVQDSYFETVGEKHGLKRRADEGYERVPLPEYKIRKWYQRRLNNIEEEYNESISKLEREVRMLKQESKKIRELINENTPTALKLVRIKGALEAAAFREANVTIMEEKLKLEKEKKLKMLEITKRSVDEQAKIKGEWSTRYENMGQGYRDEIETLWNESNKLHTINSDLRERINLYERGFTSKEEALAYMGLARDIKSMEDHLYGPDWKEERIRKSLASSYLLGKPVSIEDLSYLIEKAVKRFIDNLRGNPEQQRLNAMRQRQHEMDIKKEMIKSDDFDMS